MSAVIGIISAISLAASPVQDRGLEPINPKNSDVIPIAFTSFPSAVPTDVDSIRVRDTLRNANRYALTTWYDTVKNFDSQTGSYLNLGGVAEEQIRPPASQAFSLAISLKLGAYGDGSTTVSDDASTKISTAKAQAATLKLIRSVARAHHVNTPGGWSDPARDASGANWQTALWAYNTAMAGWLMWDELAAADREYVRKMVVYEADRLIGYQVPYYRTPTGTVLTPGDSKAEENSWNSQILQLATAMMPSHRNYRPWLSKNVELMLSAFARPNDLNNTTVYHGAPFSWWLNGSNANNDFMVINHNTIHSDYTASITQNLTAPFIAALAGAAAPAAARVNAAGVYDAMVDRAFTPGSNYPETSVVIAVPPAGHSPATMFIRNSANLYYPQGNDWGSNRRANIGAFDVMVRALGLDTLASVPASTWERLHMQKVLVDQARPLSATQQSDGRAYRLSGEDLYSGREEWVAAMIARAWWVKWVVVKNIWGFSNQAIAITIDNKDRDFSKGGPWTATLTGDQKLGTGYWSIGAGTGSNTARFSFDVPTSGSYEVYAWWSDATTNASNARFTVAHANGSTMVQKNQRTDGGQFNLIGVYAFNSGSGQYLEINDNANGRVVADAVMIIRSDTP